MVALIYKAGGAFVAIIDYNSRTVLFYDVFIAQNLTSWPRNLAHINKMPALNAIKGIISESLNAGFVVFGHF